jgi:hypothetical protein
VVEVLVMQEYHLIPVLRGQQIQAVAAVLVLIMLALILMEVLEDLVS